MSEENEIVLRIPAPSDGLETVLVMFGIGVLLLVVLTGLHHRKSVARIWDWLKSHPWERASALVNLLSWPVLIFVGPVAAVLFVMAVGEAYTLLRQTGGSGSGVGSLGRGAVIVALIGAPFVIWRSVVAQKTVNVTEQGHITDRINTAVQGLGAEKTVKRESEEYTQPNLEVRIGAIYALERIAQDSDRDHVQIMEILCAYIRQNVPAPAEDDWPKLEMKEGEEDGPLEADWEDRVETFREAQEEARAKAKLKLREDIQTALTVIGRRSAKQRRLEAGPGKEAPFPFDIPCPDYDGPEDAHDPAALDAYRKKLDAWKETIRGYAGYRLDLRGADLRGADLADRDLKGAKLDGTYMEGADLVGARLQGAQLMGARLQGAVFAGARLQGADLAEARLRGARLVGALLQGAVLMEARVQGAYLWGAQLQAADLVGARSQGAHLVGARLQGAVLWGARLQGADLGQARLQGAGLGRARLQGAHLGGARLQGARLVGVRLDKNTDLNASTLRGAALRAVDCTDLAQLAEHLPHMFGDATVTLPGGHGPEHKDWPPHWPKFDLGDDFNARWRKWQADPGNYTPPERDETT